MEKKEKGSETAPQVCFFSKRKRYLFRHLSYETFKKMEEKTMNENEIYKKLTKEIKI